MEFNIPLQSGVFRTIQSSCTMWTMSNQVDLVTGILAKISLGTGIWAKFRLGTGIWYPPSRPSGNVHEKKKKTEAISTARFSSDGYNQHREPRGKERLRQVPR